MVVGVGVNCILTCVANLLTGKAVGVTEPVSIVVICMVQAAKSRANKMKDKADLYILFSHKFATGL